MRISEPRACKRKKFIGIIIIFPEQTVGVIEWNFPELSAVRQLRYPPHSLGKLIEWKQLVSAIVLVWGIRGICTPHSLGKLIEWKLI